MGKFLINKICPYKINNKIQRRNTNMDVNSVCRHYVSYITFSLLPISALGITISHDHGS